MRLWTLHPRYLDSKGLVAAWREALLAQACLHGNTANGGYANHGQLERFKQHSSPERAIEVFLLGLLYESAARGYNFDQSKIIRGYSGQEKIYVSTAQIVYEAKWLETKLKDRGDKERLKTLRRELRASGVLETLNLFKPYFGLRTETWEVVK